MKKVYYVVEKEISDKFNIGVEEITGNKIIQLYDIVENKPLKIGLIEGNNEDNSELLINNYLEFAFNNTNFELIQL